MSPTFRIIHGDSLAVLPTLPDNSVDSIVTDPPYELGFMGKAWDNTGIANNVQLWKECLRVLKPGGHLLAFSGSRTYHRMTSAIEDAGFEIRDQIMWVYGSGFPKSLNVSKAIDKAAGAEREVVGQRSGGASKLMEDRPWNENSSGTLKVTAPATPLAKQWDGWGTALKPAHEPICVARKPLANGNTVAENVVEFGTGGLNIDKSRISVSKEDAEKASAFTGLPKDKTSDCYYTKPCMEGGNYAKDKIAAALERYKTLGRWPANFIHDGSEEVLAGFPDGAKPKPERTAKRGGSNAMHMSRGSGDNEFQSADGHWPADPGGSAARFFYCAKASKADRGDGNNHPTVKPTALMRYLVRLVTPPGGTVLDPFTGSGSTGKAAVMEGFNFTGIELTPEYIPIATARIEHALKSRVGAPEAQAQAELPL